MGNVLKLVRHAVRILARAPGFTVVAVLTLALGIGANTAIFSVLDAVLLRDPGFLEPERLVVVWESDAKRGRTTNVVGPANYMRWKERNQSFADMSAFIEWSTTVTEAGEPEEVMAGWVSSDLFDTLGVGARLGHTFRPEHGRPGTSSDVAVLSDAYWKLRFGADPNVLGRTFRLNGTPVTVIGVMPPDFRGLMNVELWAPIPFGESHRKAKGRYLTVVARLKTGVTRDRAQAEMATIAKQCEAEMPDFTGGWGVNVVPLREQLVGAIRKTLLILLGAVGLVLLIACANVANLMLARASGRSREWAVRTALGASRRQLVGQLLTECLVLAVAGGGAGLGLGAFSIGALRALLPDDLRRFTEIGLNPTVFLCTFGLTLLTGLIFGIVPALASTRGHLTGSLKEGTRGAGSGASRMRLRGALVIVEVALSLVLLAGSGLLIRSFARLSSLDPGFRSESVLSMAVSLPRASYPEPAQIAQFYDRLMTNLQTLPGVVSAGAISWQLLGAGSATSYEVAGTPPAAFGHEPVAEVRMVTPRLFETLGIPIRRGSAFTGQETREGPRLVVVNETLAREHWPHGDAIGKRIRMSWGEPILAEIIGVVGDVRLAGLDQEPRPTLYWAQSQMANSFMTLMVRSAADPALLTKAIKAEVARLDPRIPVAKVLRLEEVKAKSLTQRRFTMLLLGIFAAVSVLLAAVGIYGVIAHSVSQRTHEIGVRMALGAARGDVLGLVLRQGASLAGVGVAIGLGAGLATSRLLSSLLFDVSETDPLVFGSVAVLLGLTALAACAIPARRAASVDPTVALRYE